MKEFASSRNFFIDKQLIMTPGALSHGSVLGLVAHETILSCDAVSWIEAQQILRQDTVPHRNGGFRAWSGSMDDITKYGFVPNSFLICFGLKVPEIDHLITGKTKNKGRDTPRYRRIYHASAEDPVIIIDPRAKTIHRDSLKLLRDYVRFNPQTMSRIAQGILEDQT